MGVSSEEEERSEAEWAVRFRLISRRMSVEDLGVRMRVMDWERDARTSDLTPARQR